MPDILRHFLEFLFIGFIILGLGSLIFKGFNKTTDFSDKVYSKMDDMSVMIDESDYTKFEGADVKGSDVIAAIKGFQNSGSKICVRVKTAKSDIPYIYTDQTLKTQSPNSIANVSNKSKDNYINPGADFHGSLTRDQNGTIVMVTFEYVGTNNGAGTP